MPKPIYHFKFNKTFVKFLFTLIKIPLFYQKNEIYGKSCENMV